MPMKINKLEIENVKRVKAVKIEPNQNGLTIIGGKNNQGKTSVLDSIAWALGGERYKPSQSTRDWDSSRKIIFRPSSLMKHITVSQTAIKKS